MPIPQFCLSGAWPLECARLVKGQPVSSVCIRDKDGLQLACNQLERRNPPPMAPVFISSVSCGPIVASVYDDRYKEAVMDAVTKRTAELNREDSISLRLIGIAYHLKEAGFIRSTLTVELTKAEWKIVTGHAAYRPHDENRGHFHGIYVQRKQPS